MFTLSTDLLRVAAAAALVSACTDRGDTVVTDGTTDALGTTDADPTDAPSTGTPTTGDTTTDDPVAAEHGFVCLSLGIGESTDTNPFDGTAKVRITLEYGPCLADFYRNKHPELRSEAPAGAELFAAWKTRLCSEPVGPLAKCEVEGFEQTIGASDSETSKMAITYAIPADGDLVGRTLLWGPGPLPALAACEGGFEPTVSLRTLDGAVGLDSKGQEIWRAESFSNNTVVMGTTAEGCIQVSAGYSF